MAQDMSNMELEHDIEQVTEELSLPNNDERLASCSLKYKFSPTDSAKFPKYIDHTLLNLDAIPEQIESLCDEARQWTFKSVCVRVNYVSRAVESLRGSDVDVCCVVGFHEGTYTTREKSKEALEALQKGARELDFVVNYPLLKKRDYETVYTELKTLRDVVSRENMDVVCKLILETSQLSREDIIAGTVLAYRARFDFAKTSTGFMGHGARVEDVQLMRRTADICSARDCGNSTRRDMKIKASGGIRSLQDAVKMLEAGAGRLGCSAGVAIMSDPARSGKLASDYASTNDEISSAADSY